MRKILGPFSASSVDKEKGKTAPPPRRKIRGLLYKYDMKFKTWLEAADYNYGLWLLVGHEKYGDNAPPQPGEGEPNIGYEDEFARQRPTANSNAFRSDISPTRATPKSSSANQGYKTTYDRLGPYKGVEDGLLEFRRQYDRVRGSDVSRLVLSYFNGRPKSDFDVVAWTKHEGLMWNPKIKNDPRYAELIGRMEQPPVTSQQFNQFKSDSDLAKMLRQIRGDDSSQSGNQG